jgi:hypothetical protein
MLAGRTPFVDQLSSVVLVKQATAQPMPLLALRPDVPRSLAHAVHTLLAKNPAQRPATAAEACRMLERSVEPERRNPASESEPFATTIGALNAGRYTFTRVTTLFAVLAMLFTVAVAWSARASQTGALEELARDPAVTASALLPRKPRAARRPSAPALTREGAWRIAASVTGDHVEDVRVMGSGAGQLIAAVASDTSDATTSLFIIERGGARAAFAVTKRVSLDVEGFRGAEWTEEVVDLDDDGYDEVLCAGAEPTDGGAASRRYVVYTPRKRETYSLHLAPDSTGAHALRATWSPNTQGRDAQLFRYALRQRAMN